MSAHAIAFDTFQCAKDLKKAGFTEIQVETQIKYIKEQIKSVNEWIDDSLATKQNIKELDLKIETLRAELVAEIKLSEERTNKNIAQMGYKTIITLGSMIAVGVTALGFLLKLH
jgi:hypothetical protein